MSGGDDDDNDVIVAGQVLLKKALEAHAIRNLLLGKEEQCAGLPRLLHSIHHHSQSLTVANAAAQLLFTKVLGILSEPQQAQMRVVRTNLQLYINKLSPDSNERHYYEYVLRLMNDALPPPSKRRVQFAPVDRLERGAGTGYSGKRIQQQF